MPAGTQARGEMREVDERNEMEKSRGVRNVAPATLKVASRLPHVTNDAPPLT